MSSNDKKICHKCKNKRTNERNKIDFTYIGGKIRFYCDKCWRLMKEDRPVEK